MSVYGKILQNINKPENAALFEAIAAIVSPCREEIAKEFYREMLADDKAANFLSHDEVKKRLTESMKNWIDSVFVYRKNIEAIEEYKSLQLKIGQLHAKIGLPVSLVNYGMYIIKQEILHLLIASELNRQNLGAVVVLTNQCLDCALQIINESYDSDFVVNEKNSQAFKIQFSSHHLAVDCERLRTSLSDWMRDLLLNIQQNSLDTHSLLSIRHSSFGLWVTHKAKLFLSNRPEYTTLICLLDEMDETVHKIAASVEDNSPRQEHFKKLNDLVTQANWVLGNFAKEIINQDSGRDSLTRLFNRRFLDTVMRHETAVSIKGAVFGIIEIDIDHFKKINDSHGHDNGDKILTQLAEILSNEVRAGDFVFRQGGEEFLIVLGGVNDQVIRRIAEKIRIAVSDTVFKLADNKPLNITVSIGTAIHDGHPDFQRTIKLADDALYQAKKNGRNQVVAADQQLKND